MRRARPLILILIALILIGVGISYRARKAFNAAQPRLVVRDLPQGISAKSENWDWSKTVGSSTVVRVLAKTFEQVSDTPNYNLEGVDLRIYHKSKDDFDQVKSAKAEYDTQTGLLFSEGDVEITMGVPADEKNRPSGKLLVIKSSGVHYDSKNGKATTDRPSSFTFDRGNGESTGAEYDPPKGELNLLNNVTLHWNGKKPGDKPMEIQAGMLVYKEKESKVFLYRWSKLKRGTLTMDGGDAVITLKEGIIQLVEAEKARGIDHDPKRQVEYAADHLRMEFDEDGEVKAITGDSNARLVSTSDTTQTVVTSNRVDMSFDNSGPNAVLTKATANGKGVVEAKPIPKPNVQPADTRILRSEVIVVDMKPGGQEIQEVQTQTPGSLEFIPMRTGSKHRLINGERIGMKYGAKNQLEKFSAVSVSTRTDALPVKGKPMPPPALTWSKGLQAEFEPKGGQLSKLEQWDNFRYEEGDRKAKSDHATLEYAKNLITLEGPASRVWDPTGSTTADRIVMNQQTSDVEAMGNVSSTRVPDKDKKKAESGTGMLSGDEPLQAKAARMTTTDNNLQIRYEGNAILWQGANRLQADRVDIDRDNEKLEAHGKVISQFIDRGNEGKTAKPKSPIFTVIKAPDMTYEDQDRVAHYTGGVLLSRPGMTVQCKELRAFLKSSDSGSDLDKAFAEGAVKIVQIAPQRQRTGTSEHAEYYPADGKVILEQGQPQLVDSVRGTTRGRQLTYFSGSDRLLVDGAANEPTVSNIHRK